MYVSIFLTQGHFILPLVTFHQSIGPNYLVYTLLPLSSQHLFLLMEWMLFYNHSLMI